MRDVACLLADSIAPVLVSRPGQPVHLVNIAGGPAVDSLNALILLYKQGPQALAGRKISIHVLDIDSDGPAFGARALSALLAEDAPLHGLGEVSFEYTPYDWSEPGILRQVLEQIDTSGEVVIAGSSEGGLFEYASDDVISANLKVLYAYTPADFVMVGPVIRDNLSVDPRLRGLDQLDDRPATRFMGLEAFQKLAVAAGWRISCTLDGPMHQVACLTKK
jgi:hypothetical protein